MPKIPVYQEPQVNMAPIAGGMLSPAAPQGAFGEALAGGLSAVAQEADRQAQIANLTRVEDTVNQLRQSQLDLGYGKDGAFTLEGRNAVQRPGGQPLEKEFVGKLTKREQELRQGLSTESQRRMFDQAAGRLRTEFSGQLYRHEDAQGQRYRKSVYEGTVAAEHENVTRNYSDPSIIDQSIARVKFATKQEADRIGMAPEQTQAALLDAESAVHSAVLTRMLESDVNDPVGAKAYFEANKGYMTAKDSAHMQKAIAKDARNAQVNDVVDEVWGKHVLTDEDGAVPLDAMGREIRDKFRNDAEGQQMALAQLHERAAAHEHTVTKRQEETEGGIWRQVLDGKSLGEIMRSPVFKSGLDGKAQAHMITQIEAFHKRNADKPDSLAQFAEYWARASRPDALVGMSDAQIFALAPKMGVALTKQLLAHKQSFMNRDEKVVEASADMDSLKHFARLAGMHVESAPGAQMTDEDKATLGELKYKTETAIDAAQKHNGGKPLDRAAKDKIIKDLVIEVPVLEKGRFWGTNINRKKLFEVTDPAAIDATMTPADMSFIIGEMDKAGVQLSTDPKIMRDQLRRAYLASERSKK